MKAIVKAKKTGQATPKAPVSDFINRNINEGTPEAFWDTAKGLKDKYGPVAQKYLEKAWEAAKPYVQKPEPQAAPKTSPVTPAIKNLVGHLQSYAGFINSSSQIIQEHYKTQKTMVEVFNRLKLIVTSLQPYVQGDQIVMTKESSDYLDKLDSNYTILNKLAQDLQRLSEKGFEAFSKIPDVGLSQSKQQPQGTQGPTINPNKSTVAPGWSDSTVK